MVKAPPTEAAFMPAPSHSGQTRGTVPDRAPVPGAVGAGRVGGEPERTVTPSIESTKPIVASVSRSAPRRGAAVRPPRVRVPPPPNMVPNRSLKPPPALAEQVADVEAATAAGTAPGGEGPEPAGAHLVVAAALLRVADHVVGLGDGLEPVLGRLVTGVGVGMVGARELAVGLLDLVGRCVLRHPEDLVEVLGHPVGAGHALASLPRRLRSSSLSAQPSPSAGSGSTTVTRAGRTTRSPIW